MMRAIDRAGIRAAVLALPLRKDLLTSKAKLNDLVDQTASRIALDLSLSDEKSPTPKQTAKQLEDVATALAKLKVALSKLQPDSQQEFAIATREKRDATRDLRDLAEIVFKSDLQVELTKAATAVRSAPKRSQGGKTRAMDVACTLASCYALATGEPPGTGRGEGRLAAFIQSVFDLLGMKESAAHFANKAATEDESELRRLLAKLS